jgi:iron(III) transport system substrate-binding protein
MISRRAFTLASTSWMLGACDTAATNYTNQSNSFVGNSKLRQAAAKEGTLRIDTATDQHEVEDLLESFRYLHPDISVEYRHLSSSDLHANFLREAAERRQTADIIISSAMDLQFKLVNDGFAQAYASPEKLHLPSWAVWKDEAYAVTAEPIVFVYNRRLMPEADVPASHEGLADLLRRKPDEYYGKIATYDPERSGTGYLYYAQDLLISRDTIELAQAVGRTRPKFYILGVEMIDKVARGEHLLAYNMMSSYVLEKKSQDPDIEIIFPNDYTLVMSRIAVIPKVARHPSASKLFLDFLLSGSGQTLLAARHMQPIRSDIPMVGAAPSPEVLRPIHFGPSLLANLDQFRRLEVLREWRRTFES